MKTKGSTATKADKKNTPAPKKSGRGGARAGAGKKKVYQYGAQLNIDTPNCIIDGLNAAGVTNKTVLINGLLAGFLAKQDIPEAIKQEINDYISKIGTVNVIEQKEEE